MRKYIYILAVLLFVAAVFVRTNRINSMAEQDAAGTEQYYQTNGIPVEVNRVMHGDFLVFCRVNAQIMGFTQNQISTTAAAKILKVHHQVGDMVGADEVIISLDKEDPRSSAQYRQLKAVHETTLKNFRRMSELRESGAVSQSQLDEIKMKLDVDRANLESVVETVSLSSPVDGVILDINAREGELITPGKPVAVVARVDRVRLIAEVSESDMLCIKPDQKVIVNGNEGRSGNLGDVTKVSLNANPYTGLFRVEMEVDNRDGSLRIGTYTTVRIEVISDHDTLYADVRALQRDTEGRHFVYVVNRDHVARTPIEISGLNDEYMRVLSGVSENDMVVVNGFKRLSDNARVLY